MPLDKEAIEWLEKQADFTVVYPPRPNYAKQILDYLKPIVQTEEYNTAAHKSLQEQLDKLNKVG